VSGFVPNWLSVSMFRRSVYVVSLAMKRPSKSSARVSIDIYLCRMLGQFYPYCVLCRWVAGEKVASLSVVCEIPIDR